MSTFGILFIVVCALLIVALYIVTLQRNRARNYSRYSPSDSGVTIRPDEYAAEQKQRIETLEQLVATKETEHAAELTAVRSRITERLQELAAEYREKRLTLERDFAEQKRAEAKLTAERSRTALVAKIGEHFAPLLGGFPYNFKDARHVGELFDFLVFDGLEDGEIRKIVFLEIKTKRTGARVSNKRERMLRDAIKAGRVAYEVFVPDVNGAKDDRSPDVELARPGDAGGVRATTAPRRRRSAIDAGAGEQSG